MQRNDSYSSGLDLRTLLFYISLALVICQDEEICVDNCISRWWRIGSLLIYVWIKGKKNNNKNKQTNK